MLRNAVRIFCLLMIVMSTAFIQIQAAAIIADHQAVAQFDQIPPTVVEQVKNMYRLFYGHTSHGSQIVTGMTMLREENPLYDYNNGAGTLSLAEYGSDLGHYGDTAWAAITRQYLDQPGNDFNVVIWSWCGGCSDNTEEGINAYLNKVAELEQEYPNVIFIYMTGHLDGTGAGGNLYARNNQIRAFCAANGKALFDFADIESYDPNGTYYPDESDYCSWCYDWCAAYPCPSCSDCAHSHCFNCYQKGKAFWWLLARLAGWNSQPPGCGNANGDGAVNLADAVYVINYVFKGGPAPDPLCIGDANSDDAVNLADAVYVVNYVFKSGPSPVETCCP